MSKEKAELKNNEEWFCLNCGTAQKGNTTVGSKTKDRILTCSDCEIQIRFYIMSPPKKTIPEAAKSFEATLLSDSQRYGGTTRGKKRIRKEKRKK